MSRPAQVTPAAREAAADPEPRNWRETWQSGWFLGTVSLIVVLGLWELAGRLGRLNPLFFATPSQIAISAWDVFVRSGAIWPDIWSSLQVGLIGLVASILVGVPLGCIMGRYRVARRLLEPYVAALYSTPRVALVPLIILILGVGLAPKVIVVFLGAVFPLLVNSQVGVEQVDEGLIEAARSFRASERQIFFKVILPSALPVIFGGFRLSIGLALIMIVVAEFFATSSGIGFFIQRQAANFKSAPMLVGVLIFTFLGIILSQLARVVQRRLLPWSGKD